MSLFLILTAAGSSSRMGQKGKKEYLPLGDGTVLSKSLKAFLNSDDFTAVIITIPQKGENTARQALACDKELAYSLQQQGKQDYENIFFIEGGDSRQSSIYNALIFLKERFPEIQSREDDIVLVHDAARPYVTKSIIQDCINCVVQFGAAVPAIPAVDTQKESSEGATIERHLERKRIVAVQTPQAFLLAPFIRCHERAYSQGLECTDDTQVWDSFPDITAGKKVHIVQGDIMNKKITYPQDLPEADSSREVAVRIGLGTDLHQLVPGRRFLLGGVEIPAEKGELGHSDADVLLHAITDALLGASGLGDIGSYFPPEEARWKDADSALLLKTVWTDIQEKGWKLINLDCVVEFEKPKFLPWREKVIESVAYILGVEKNKVFVKAKTNEGLDAVGSSLAIKAYCVCLLQR